MAYERKTYDLLISEELKEILTDIESRIKRFTAQKKKLE